MSRGLDETESFRGPRPPLYVETPPASRADVVLSRYTASDSRAERPAKFICRRGTVSISQILTVPAKEPCSLSST